MRVITFKADEELLEMLDTFARLKGVTRSEVIRKALELYLDRVERKQEGLGPRYKRVVLRC